MRIQSLLAVLATLALAGSAQAAQKLYNASAANGTPGDAIRAATNLCPPVEVTGIHEGYVRLLDDNLGTVTLDEISDTQTSLTDLGPDQLTITFGPGAFIFIDAKLERNISAPQTSNTSGIGAHGPSGTDPGETAEWGVISGWTITGANFCLSSPVGICNNAGFSHGATVANVLPSDTYDLGTWNFDAQGDYAAAEPYIRRTSNGGLQNNLTLLRGAFQGASLPALPLVGFGALALGLAAIGARSLVGRS
jgi:hypothetical protein